MSGWGAFGDAHPLASSSSEESGGYQPPSFGSSNQSTNQSTRISKDDDPLRGAFGRSNDSDTYSFSNQPTNQPTSHSWNNHSSNDSSRISGFGSSQSTNQSTNQSSNSWSSSNAASSTSWNSPDPSATQWNSQSNNQSVNQSMAGQFSNPESSGCLKCASSPSRRRLICLLVITIILILFIAGIIVASGVGDGPDGGSDVPIDQSSTGGPGPGPDNGWPTGGARPANPLPWLESRLTTDVKPTHYDLSLTLDLGNAIYTGVNTVSVDLKRDMQYLVMHSMVTGITNVKINDVESVFRLNATYQYLIIDLPQTMGPTTDVQIAVTFAGNMKTDSDSQTGGFFLSTYQDSDQSVSRVMSSLLQPAFARFAFPCFDEPEFGAVWDISVASGAKYPTVLSNMPHRQQIIQPDQSYLTHFESTPEMSPHLVSIHISDYSSVQQTATCQEQEIAINVWAPTFIISAATVPAQIAKRQSEYFCNYFDLPYVMPKEDHVVVPNFPFGGLESFGLMSYSTKMLYDPKENTVFDLLSTVGVLSHQQSHQYFGDLVTAGWWTDLALTASFSTYFAFAGGNASNAELMMGAQFLLQAEDTALAYDSSIDSRPLITSVTSTNAYPLAQGVDKFPYQKAGSLIRMVREIIGEHAFHTGVKDFLSDYVHKTAYSVDIFEYLTHAYRETGGDLDVSSFMYTWMTHAGYPLLTCASYSGDETEEWKCTQERFFTYDGHPIDNTKWDLYVTSLEPTISTPQFPLWLHGADDASLTFTVPTSTPFVKLNVDETGFFRVLYDNNNWARLAAGLRSPGFGGLDADDRINLFDDAFVFAQQDLITYPVWGNLTRYLVREMDPLVWMKASPQLQFIYDQLPLGTIRSRMSTYLRRQMLAIATTIDVSANTNNLNITRAYLMDSVGVPLVRMDYEARTTGNCPFNSLCNRLNTLFLQVMVGKPLSEIDPAVIAIMFEVATNLHGLEEVHARYQKARAAIIPGFPGEADRVANWMIQAMGSTTNRADLLTVIDGALDDSYIHPDDAASLLQAVCSHQLGRDRFLRMLDDDFDGYLAFFKEKPEVFGGLLEYILNRIHSQSDLVTMRQMLTGRTPPPSSAITKAFARGEAQAIKNIEWQNKYLSIIMSWVQTLT